MQATLLKVLGLLERNLFCMLFSPFLSCRFSLGGGGGGGGGGCLFVFSYH